MIILLEISVVGFQKSRLSSVRVEIAKSLIGGEFGCWF